MALLSCRGGATGCRRRTGWEADECKKGDDSDYVITRTTSGQRRGCVTPAESNDRTHSLDSALFPFLPIRVARSFLQRPESDAIKGEVVVF
jgi:hypothetical protein